MCAPPSTSPQPRDSEMEKIFLCRSSKKHLKTMLESTATASQLVNRSDTLWVCDYPLDIPSTHLDPPHNTLVLGKVYEWNDFSTLPQETCVPLPPLTAAQPCTLRYVWGMDWNRRAKFWNCSTTRGGRVCPLECPLAGHTRSCHSWSETNPGHSNKNTPVVQTPPTNIPSVLLTNVSKWPNERTIKFQIKQNLLIIFRGNS